MIPLEDNVGDIIGKAQRGLGISDSKLAEKARVGSETIRKLREGDVDEAALLSVAPILGLNAQALRDLAKGEWHPKKIEARDGLAQFNTDYHGMAVNAYLVWDPASHGAAAFDTGAATNSMYNSSSSRMLTPTTSQTCRVCARKLAEMFLHRLGNQFLVRNSLRRENVFALATCKSTRD